MSSLATSSPVSASTLAYLMRWPVFRLSWLNETFSDSEVAGYGTGAERKAQEAFPVRAGGHERGNPKNEGGSDSRRTADHGSDILHPSTRRYFWVSTLTFVLGMF